MSFALLQEIDDLRAEVSYWKDLAKGNAADAQVGRVAALLGLSRAEAWIVNALHTTPGGFLSTQYLMANHPGWKRGDEREGNIIQVFIHRIRRKIGVDSITTVRGMGYQLGERIGLTLAAQNENIQRTCNS